MNETTTTERFKIHTGDVLEVLKTLPDNYFDATLSDPPYGISFMGKQWDKGVPSEEVYAELLRVLKPGAFGIHFGGTRTFHRLAVNMEDAGFEIRDCLSWLYGSGFPKSYNISIGIDKKEGVMSARGKRASFVGNNRQGEELGICKPVGDHKPITTAATQWDGYGTALKPAWEPALLVQKPVAKTFANNALTYGCGGLNIEGARVGNETIINGQGNDNMFHGNFSGNVTDPVKEGRFPANLILDEEAAAMLDATTDNSSRFFYCAKVSPKERNGGLGGEFPTLQEIGGGGTGTTASSKYGSEKAPAKNNHPTLKPIALTEYLAKLLLVPARTDGQPRRILVPFSGSGSEMIGCLKAGWDEVVGIEINPDYVEIAVARIKHHTTN